jgi:hypothetical protein
MLGSGIPKETSGVCFSPALVLTTPFAVPLLMTRADQDVGSNRTKQRSR